MYHCLNKRRHRNEISPTNEQEDIPQKLQTRNQDKHQELPHGANERRRKALELYREALEIYREIIENIK